MNDMIESVVAIGDLIVVPLTVVAIVLCFRKGRTTAGWIGVAALAVGAVSSFPLFRFLRERDAEGWLLAPLLIGIAVLVFLGREARKPALPGSRADRRRSASSPAAHR